MSVFFSRFLGKEGEKPISILREMIEEKPTKKKKKKRGTHLPEKGPIYRKNKLTKKERVTKEHTQEHKTHQGLCKKKRHIL